MLDAGGGGGVIGGAAMGAAMGSISKSMAKFASTAAAGGFEVSEEGGQALIDTITAFQRWATEQSDNTNLISQTPMLGASNGAEAMKPFAQQVALDAEGFTTQLQALLQSLEQAKEGIRTAMENYRNTDEASQSTLHQSGGTLAV
jgi:hypothetical protein